MCQSGDVTKMACKGAPTISVHTGTGDMEKCQVCETVVARDLLDHPLFGFSAGCPKVTGGENGRVKHGC